MVAKTENKKNLKKEWKQFSDGGFHWNSSVLFLKIVYQMDNML